MKLLHQKFPGCIISRNSEIGWPPRSRDLTPLDFFLWCYLKRKVYVNKYATIQQLKDEITHQIGHSQGVIYIVYLEKSKTVAEQHYAESTANCKKNGPIWQRKKRSSMAGQTGRIRLRIATASTVFSRFGPVRLLFNFKLESLSPCRNLDYMRRSSPPRRRTLQTSR